ncbi:hypothetical protein F3K39_28165 [Streptomyces sp. LBUM 1479]|uniref:hypothetical protein n=1 Tax=Streptomyces scabiei TaxID=1930 RepID=UPI000765BF3C|nr:hypothetical protein [Streptomyces scabiei]MBP5931812.1 hypothetical protein [Streptomyces sp. LBUM 1479]MDX3028251.1 hypothetical protein [Streptomyces scabiei]
MTKTTRVSIPADRPAARPGYCSWHQGHDRAVRLVRVTADQGSGVGTPDHYACAPCRHAYDLTPVGRP